MSSTLLNLEKENYTGEELTDRLIKELEDLDISGSTREDRFALHKVYFEALINNQSIFNDLLVEIKNEYEECINTILRGKRELIFVVSKLAETVGAVPTLRNYENRGKDLQRKISLLQQDNMRIMEKIKAIRQQRKERMADAVPLEATAEAFKYRSNVPQIPDLTMDEQLHIPTLKKKLTSVTQRLSKSKDDHKKRYYHKKSQQNLLDRLLQKEEMKNNLEKATKSLELKLCALNVSFSEALEKVGKKTDALEKIANVLQLSKDDFVDQLIIKDKAGIEDRERTLSPVKDSESLLNTSSSETKLIQHHDAQDTEILANCKATFQELLENKDFEEAALLVAHAPRGVLRTKETFNILKEQGSGVLKIYWDALLSTLLIQREKLSAWESAEYVGYSLENGEKEQLIHWIAQNVIDDSTKIADQIFGYCRCTDGSCHCGLWGLAETVFTRIGDFKKAMACLLHQGRCLGALEYASERGPFDKKDLLDIFCMVPSKLLAIKLSHREKPFDSLFTIEEVISILMKTQDDITLTRNIIKRAAIDEGYYIDYSAIHKPGMSDNSRETIQKWKDLYQSCWDLGLHSLAKKLFAYVIVKDAMATAKKVHFVKRHFRA